MSSRRHILTSALLGLGLGVAPWSSASAQISPSMSSGSGPGTGTGGSSFRPNAPGGAMTRPRPDLGPLPRADLPNALEGLADPSAGLPITGLRITREQANRMINDLGGLADAIKEPSQRVGALDRTARAEIQAIRDSRAADNLAKLDAARASLGSAWQALRQVTNQLVHDNRAVSLAETLMLLGDVYQDQALVSDELAFIDESMSIAPRPASERRQALVQSLQAYAMAAGVAAEVRDLNVRGEILYRVADSLARSGQEIATSRVRIIPASPGEVPEVLDQDGLADEAIAAAGQHARRIFRPVWRYRALVAVSQHAASANRFDQAVTVARTIEEPQSRAEALIRAAEAQARTAGEGQAATRTYTEAAQSVASIPRQDPRAILADVLISSLILSGRFQDALASVGLLTDPVDRYEALGTIAEQMGRRGLDREAKSWILSKATPEHQPHLLRRVAMGMVASIEQYRTNSQSGRVVEPLNVELPTQPATPSREPAPPTPEPIRRQSP
ncbi:MAG: hypothetical protein U0800_14600 [Isosphaeraceae bacterium]